MSNMIVIFIVSVVFIRLEEKANLNCIKKYVKIKITPSEGTKILEFNQFYPKQVDGCAKNPENRLHEK